MTRGGQAQGLSGSLNIVATLTSKYLQKVFFLDMSFKTSAS